MEMNKSNEIKKVGKGYRYDQKTKNEILELYADPSITVDEISQLTGVGTHTISRFAKEAGVLRRPRDTEYSRVCHFCKRSIALKEIQFCPYCGNDIRTSEERIKIKVKKLYVFQSLIPSGSRNEYAKLVNEIMNDISTLDKERRK